MKSPGTRALARPRQTFLHQNEAQPEGSHSPLSLELDPPAQTLTLQPLSSSQGLLWPEDHTFLILLFLTFFIPGREHSCPCHRQSPNTHTHTHTQEHRPAFFCFLWCLLGERPPSQPHSALAPLLSASLPHFIPGLARDSTSSPFRLNLPRSQRVTESSTVIEAETGMDPSGILKWETLRLPPAQLQGNHRLCGIGDFLGQEQNYYGAAPSLSL